MGAVFRFSNTRTGEHFYTTSFAERRDIIAVRPDYKYEGAEFLENGDAEVARFVRLDTGTHFYTADPVERDYIQNNLSATYRLESAQAFTVSTTRTETASQAVYRFYDTASGTHFFTASETERDVVSATLTNFHYEGIAFYAAPMVRPPTPSGVFDEAWYLSAYPDVRDAVNAGTISALQHYQLFGAREGRMPNDMPALAGNDTWRAYESAPGHLQVLNGGSGNDLLDGIDDYGSAGGTLQGGVSDSDDLLFGETGDDLLYGAQNDTLNGGSGNDWYEVHSPGVQVSEGSSGGIDTVYVREDYRSGVYDYALPKNVEIMQLAVELSEAVPVFTGSDNGDWIGNGGAGIATAVRLNGGAGNDTLNGGAGQAVVDGGSGDDYLVAVGDYNSGKFYRIVGSGDGSLIGGTGNDTLVAWAGNDRLSGGDGNDTFLIDIGSPPTTLWQDPQAPASYPAQFYRFTSWRNGTTTINDFASGEDLLSFRHTTLSLDDIMARFENRSVGLPAIQATFSTAELGLTLPNSGTPTTFTLDIEGVNKAQMTAGWFSVSSE